MTIIVKRPLNLN